MDIGTAKERGEWKRIGLHKVCLVNGVPHYLMDFLDPGKFFTMAEFKDEAITRINTIIDAGHVPIVSGGTGLYVHALVDNLSIPKIAPNKKLRASLEENQR